MDVDQRRSPLIRGKLEIPVEVAVAMPYSDVNKKALEEYGRLVNNHYEEPVDGNFCDCTEDILSAIDNTDKSDTDTDPEDNEHD